MQEEGGLSAGRGPKMHAALQAIKKLYNAIA